MRKRPVKIEKMTKIPKEIFWLPQSGRVGERERVSYYSVLSGDDGAIVVWCVVCYVAPMRY